MRIGVLSNLRADRRDAKLARVTELLSRHPEVFHAETADGEAVAPAMREMARREIDILVINGGDGTVQHALTYLLRQQAEAGAADARGADANAAARLPWLAPICGGRTNTTARDLGAQRDPVRGLTALIEAVGAGRVSELATERPVLRVEFDGGVEYGAFLGFGVVERAARLVHEGFPDGKARGALGAGIVTATLVVRTVLGRDTGGLLAADEMDVTLDGQPLASGVMRLAIVSTLRRLFLGLVPFWGTEQAPLYATFAEARVRNVARVVAGILLRRPGPLACPENGYHSRNVHELEVRFDGGLMLDGELFGPMPGRRVRVSATDDLRWLRA